MEKHRHKYEWFIFSGSSKITDSNDNSRSFQFINRAHSLHTFHIIAGICQFLLGLAVVTVSVLGLVTPFWLSAALVMLGSVTTMIGLYLIYLTVARSNSKKMLLRNAMKRIMESKN